MLSPKCSNHSMVVAQGQLVPEVAPSVLGHEEIAIPALSAHGPLHIGLH